ncbi:hypothetical protein, partial [Phaeobacter sp. JH203A]|uniref:hypothetical protein n=1 Tax=Phaeobacter sp. JH203A TaxID=3112501 RepID=UPI003A86ED0C
MDVDFLFQLIAANQGGGAYLPPNGTILSSFATPGSGTYGLAFDGTNLISCDNGSDRIYIHDGISSTILSSFASPSGNPTGLAF